MTLLTCLVTCAVTVGGPSVPSGPGGAGGRRWPLGPPAPAVVRGFSPPPHPWGAGHRGVDLAGRPGEPVYAAAAGRVSFSGRVAGRGVVAVRHGTVRTTYLPVRPSVPAGREVRAGTRIGTLAAGSHCRVACLHWGLLRGDTYLDPLSLVRPRVRLLPIWPTRSTRSVPPSPKEPPMDLNDATAAGGGVLAGMMLAFTLVSLRRTGRPRRPAPPGVVDLDRERTRRRTPTPDQPQSP